MKRLSFLFIMCFISLFSFSQSSENSIFYDFSLEQYNDFLIKLKQNPNIVFVKQKDFMAYDDTTKIVVSFRHDIDVDMNTAMDMALIENENNVVSTYFVLHTADYYHPKNDFSTHNNSVLKQMLFLQSLGHEVGIHNDLITLQVVYGISPTWFLHNEVNWMRTNGLKIYGSASHGSSYCHIFKYMNFYFFNECRDYHSDIYVNKDSVIRDGEIIYLEHVSFLDFDFTYEGYFIGFNKYYSDCSYDINGYRFNPTKVDISKWKPGDKIVILMHPIHWKKQTNSIIVYPNPAKNYFNIVIDKISSQTEVAVEIYDLTGNKVDYQNFYYRNGIRKEINLLKGIYFVRISYEKDNNSFVYSKKIIVEN